MTISLSEVTTSQEEMVNCLKVMAIVVVATAAVVAAVAVDAVKVVAVKKRQKIGDADLGIEDTGREGILLF